jgi:hypothetical protein
MKNTLIRQNVQTHMSYGTMQCVRGRTVLYIASLLELSFLLKGILPSSQGFQVCMMQVRHAQECQVLKVFEAVL